MKTNKSSDPWSHVVIFVTFALFLFAIFLKGIKHDLLLETGVFLVSVKLILMMKKISGTESRLEQRLIQIQEIMANSGGLGRSGVQ